MPDPVVVRLPETASTMDDAKALAEGGAPHGSLVRADRQTGGRGRAGRAWASPAGGLWFSVVLRPVAPPSLWTLLPLAAGLAVVEGLRAGDVAARLKWPNDVVVSGRKVAGVLVEAKAPEYAVVGIGANVGVRDGALPSDVASIAGSIASDDATRERVFEAAYAGLLRRATRLGRSGSEILAEYRALCTTLGEAVVRGDVAGRAVAIDDAGALVVETPDGRRVRVVEAP